MITHKNYMLVKVKTGDKIEFPAWIFYVTRNGNCLIFSEANNGMGTVYFDPER